MSHLPKDWEADIREQVNEHEFAYDPAAWGEMSSLLDQVATGSTGAKAVPDPVVSGSLKLWSIIAIATAVAVTMAIVLWQRQQKAQKPAVESWTIEVTPIQKLADTITATPKKQIPVRTPITKKRALSKELPVLVPEVLSEVSSSEPLPIRKTTVVISPLSQVPLPKELQPLAPPPPEVLPEVQLPPQPRRKRNRKTLFPDVIENYKN